LIGGVTSVSWGYPVPFDTNGRGIELYVDGVTNGENDQTVGVSMSVIDADFFRTIGTPLLEGRDFAAYDTSGAPHVLIVNRALAQRFWQQDNVAGRRVRLGGVDGEEAQIVGVVADAVFQSPTQPPPPMAFLPMGQATSTRGLTLIAHTQDAPTATLARIRSIVRETDPGVAAYGAMTMTRAVRNAINVQESSAAIAAVIGAIALLLAAVGLYGVVAYTVDRRKREVGIRMALGATRSAVLAMVLRRAARTAFAGVAVGLVLAALIGQLLASFLFQVKPLDPLAFAVVSATLVGVVLLASYIPARRAARVDPIVTLRSD
jgi:predicted permease